MTHRSPVSRPSRRADFTDAEERDGAPEVLTLRIRKALTSIRSHLPPKEEMSVEGISADSTGEVTTCRRCVALAFKVKKLETEVSCVNERNQQLRAELRELRASKHKWEDQRDTYIDRLARVKEWIKLTKAKHKMEKEILMKEHEEQLRALGRELRQGHEEGRTLDKRPSPPRVPERRQQESPKVVTPRSRGAAADRGEVPSDLQRGKAEQTEVPGAALDSPTRPSPISWTIPVSELTPRKGRTPRENNISSSPRRPTPKTASSNQDRHGVSVERKATDFDAALEAVMSYVEKHSNQARDMLLSARGEERSSRATSLGGSQKTTSDVTVCQDDAAAQQNRVEERASTTEPTTGSPPAKAPITTRVTMDTNAAEAEKPKDHTGVHVVERAKSYSVPMPHTGTRSSIALGLPQPPSVYRVPSVGSMFTARGKRDSGAVAVRITAPNQRAEVQRSMSLSRHSIAVPGISLPSATLVASASTAQVGIHPGGPYRHTAPASVPVPPPVHYSSVPRPSIIVQGSPAAPAGHMVVQQQLPRRVRAASMPLSH
ncbi:hypothetical protein FOL46_009958 [Perkinsus olseni]|uniref:Uncharacterized protein n=1 Tax=Perkinsus olseni TaxID=32597 RepID=A0A7J6ML59_PEROL|nr:hypothetical protein FOL46_009958 [Perkinsus olseni]